jgi:protein phosphatase 1L
MAETRVKLSFGTSVCMGKRKTMEDEYFIERLDNDVKFCAVLDGHTGDGAAKYFKDILPKKFRERFISDASDDEISDLITKIFLETDEEWVKIQLTADPWKLFACESGTTFTGVVIVKNRLITINLGDSRTVISKSGRIISETTDHKTLDMRERDLAVQRGGTIKYVRCNPVYIGGYGSYLAVTRSLGDVRLKVKESDYTYAGKDSIISPVPDVVIHDMNYTDGITYVILGSDGIFDVISSGSVAAFVHENDSKDLNEIAKNLVDKCEHGSDNKTVVIVRISE